MDTNISCNCRKGYTYRKTWSPYPSKETLKVLDGTLRLAILEICRNIIYLVNYMCFKLMMVGAMKVPRNRKFRVFAWSPLGRSFVKISID
jgi:hypothetical protein